MEIAGKGCRSGREVARRGRTESEGAGGGGGDSQTAKEDQSLMRCGVDMAAGEPRWTKGREARAGTLHGRVGREGI